MTHQLILASTSPRRIELLSWTGIQFKAADPNVDETKIRHSSPYELTRLLAEAKASALQNNLPNSLIIGSDAVVYFQGKIYEKPISKEHQREMIYKQIGKEAEVYSSVCIINSYTGEKYLDTKVTPYKIAELSEKQIEHYIATKQGLDKASGYGLQDEDGMFVSTINGCYTNILGFPLCIVTKLLNQFGVNVDININQIVKENTGRIC